MMGPFPAIDQHTKCARCGHAWSFHSKQLAVQCKAMGCKGGLDSQRCSGFVLMSLSAQA